MKADNPRLYTWLVVLGQKCKKLVWQYTNITIDRNTTTHKKHSIYTDHIVLQILALTKYKNMLLSLH